MDRAHVTRPRHRAARGAAACLTGAVLLVAAPGVLRAESFSADLARIDAALRKNPDHVNPAALESCRSRRNFAVRLQESGQTERAERSLRFCRDVLGLESVADSPGAAATPAVPTAEEVQARATRELEKALALEANVAHGLAIYRECAACHGPEGWGLSNGSVPQLAGQHRRVVIKQLADIRAGNRDNVLMAPYSSVESIGGAQSVADVAGYIDTLEISTANGKGPGVDLALGEEVYRENCARCHGESGEGNTEDFTPRIQSQHYNYLVRQFEWIKAGKRRNANQEMVEQIHDFDEDMTHAVLDYVSRLEPPPELQAPPGWHNPDFPN